MTVIRTSCFYGRTAPISNNWHTDCSSKNQTNMLKGATSVDVYNDFHSISNQKRQRQKTKSVQIEFVFIGNRTGSLVETEYYFPSDISVTCVDRRKSNNS